MEDGTGYTKHEYKKMLTVNVKIMHNYLHAYNVTYMLLSVLLVSRLLIYSKPHFSNKNIMWKL